MSANTLHTVVRAPLLSCVTYVIQKFDRFITSLFLFQLHLWDGAGWGSSSTATTSSNTPLAYFERIKEYGMRLSVSRHGTRYDNTMAENLFSSLKTECIYRHKPNHFNQANSLIDNYISFYNYMHIQLNWSGAANATPLRLKPLTFSMGLFVQSV